MVFYQLMGATLDERHIEAEHFTSISPGKIGLKIPCTYENISLAAGLKSEGRIIGITAVFSAAQAYLAIQARIDFISLMSIAAPVYKEMDWHSWRRSDPSLMPLTQIWRSSLRVLNRLLNL
jgi:hypothetical protein